MDLDPRHVGTRYGPFSYVIGLEKMREYDCAVRGGVPSLGFPPVRAVSSAARDEVAFPTFCATFAIAPFRAAVTDPALGIDLLRLVHGEQEFEFFEAMRAGDTMITTGEIVRILSKGGKDFLTVVTESTNQQGKLVVRGTWTAVIRHRP
jgi:hypothetical protein